MSNNYSEIIDDEIMKDYSKNWKRPQIYKDIEKAKENEKDNDEYELFPKEIEDNKVIELFEPKGAQIEALYELENSRKEGFRDYYIKDISCTYVNRGYVFLH